jgi:hypothetical protein
VAFPGRAAAQYIDPVTLTYLAGAAVGGAIAGVKYLVDETGKHARIGAQSAPTVVPEIGDLRLLAFPLNSTGRTGQTPFVICVVPHWTGSERRLWPRAAAFDPKGILLHLPDGTRVRPSGYAVQPCPFPEYSAYAEIPFKALDTDAPLVVKRDVPGLFPHIAVRFDAATLDPDQEFSLDLGALVLDGKRSHQLPRIGFAPYYGQIRGR